MLMMSSSEGASTCFWTYRGTVAGGVYFFDRSNLGDASLIAVFTVAESLAATDIVQCLTFGCAPDDGQVSQLLLWLGGGLVMVSTKGLEVMWVMRRGGTIGTPEPADCGKEFSEMDPFRGWSYGHQDA